MNKREIAFGVITRNLFDIEPYNAFLVNAEKYGHKVSNLIIAYEDDYDRKILKKLQEHCEVTLIKRGEAAVLYDYLDKLGMNNKHIEMILGAPFHEKYDMISYGTSRNYVLLTALMKGIDYLMFFDTDIYPKILSEFNHGKSKFIDIDFVGSHLKYLTQDDVALTTSDYTGYYIIPKMKFPYLMDLLTGVQKKERYYYISSVDSPVTRDKYLENIFNTQKALGGNLALDLTQIDILPPFFSTTLVIDNECFLGRGEDTLFGPEMHGKARCVDIDLLVFHDCFGDYPKKPDIFTQKNLDRFYYACMGWIIRNPFYNWLIKQINIVAECGNRSSRYEALVIGSRSAAEYFQDERFLKLPKAYKLSYEKLDDDIEKYRGLMKAWNELRKLIKRREE